MQNTSSHRASSRRHTAAFAICSAIESLELRVLMHGGSEDGRAPANLRTLPPEILAKLDDGHFTTAEYLDLSLEQQALVSPHQIEDDRSLQEQLDALGPITPNRGASGDADYALPDLVPLTGNGYLVPVIDKTEQPGRNLLRFTTAVGNQGDGPAILYSGNTPEWQTADGRQLVKQRLFNYANNTFTQTSERDAGHFIFHPAHGHFHLENYAMYTLLNTDGSPVYRSDGTQAVGDKVGFCLVNIATSFTMTNGQASTTLPGYNKAGQPSTSCGFVQGIHVGRADVYDKQYDGQWIDVTGVPNGNYLLEVTLDGSNAIMEKDETNNTVRVPVTINTTPAAGGIAHDIYDTAPAQNNDFAHATDLGELGVATQSGLTMHADADVDYFKFTAASSGTYNVDLVVANRIVDLFVYDSQQHEIGLSTNPKFGTPTAPITQRVTYTFTKGQTYYAKADGFAGSDLNGTGDTGGLSDNYALRVSINPTVSTAAPIDAAAEDGAAAGSFQINRNGPFSSALNVNFTVGGTAQRGVDYDLYYNGGVFTGNTMIIGVESLSETISVVPRPDADVEATETVTLTLNTNAAYVLDTGTTTSSVTIADAAPRMLQSDFAALTNEVRFKFSLDVSASLDKTDLQIVNRKTGETSTVVARSVAWDAAQQIATFTLSAPLPPGNYEAVLPAASITHALGAPLAADATDDFAYLPADGNLDGKVDFNDLTPLAQHYNGAGTFAEGDYNYDGQVNFDDLVILAQYYNETSLQQLAAQLAGTFSTAAVATSGKARGRVAPTVL